MSAEANENAGFWIRVLAALIDSVLILLIIVPLLTAVYGTSYWFDGALIKGPADVLINYVLPALAIIVFWIYRSATPGKLILGLRIVDAGSGNQPSTAQFIGRYLGYYVAAIPLFIGLIWVAIDKRKQGWHDKLANTRVVRLDKR